MMRKKTFPACGRKLLIPGAAILIIAIVLCLPLLVQAQPTQPTSTPDAEGIIYVEVQPNDSFWAIAARAGLTLEELLELNGLTEDTIMQPGDLLIIGYGTPPATPTSDIPTPTLSPPTPIATSPPLRTAICLTAFEDTNQNSVHEPGEPLRSGVAFTIYDATAVVANYITDGQSEPFCIEELAAGTYHVTRSIARDEILTTQGDWAITLVAGTVLEQAFGSITGVPTPTAPPPTEPAAVAPTPQPINQPTGAPTPILTILLLFSVTVLLISAAVLIFWVGFARKKR